MSASHNDNETDEFKRWTAKRKIALVLQILRGETTAAEAARSHDLTLSEIEQWRDKFLAGGENLLRSNPRDEIALKDKEIGQLYQKIGKLTMDIEVLQIAFKVQGRQAPFVTGSSSDE